MTTTNNTIKIGKTTYNIESVDGSNCDYIDINAHIVGPRGGHKAIVAFRESCVRVISYSGSGCPRGHKDIHGSEADEIVETLKIAKHRDELQAAF